MGDEHEGDADVALDRLELDLHLLPELEVERAERLVEQEHAGAVDQRAGERDALSLAPGELAGAAPLEPLQAHRGEGLLRAAVPLGPLDLAHAEPVLDVPQHVEVGEQRVVLEDGVDVALERGAPGDVDPAELDRAVGRELEAGDQPEHGGLARARRAEHGEELAVGDVEVHAVDRDDGAERLAQAAEPDGGHGRRRGRGAGRLLRHLHLRTLSTAEPAPVWPDLNGIPWRSRQSAMKSVAFP